MPNKTLTEKLISSVTGFVRKKLKHVYYHTQESLGQHKRDLVVVQVEQACSSLQQSRDQFSDALEKFKTVIWLEETSLEQKYRLLKRHYDNCKLRADDVSSRIVAIEEVSEALFNEWEDELLLYQSRSLRSRSKQQLKTSRQYYAKLLKNLTQAEAKIMPVLAAFQDQVLFLKHNLNAQAIAALQHEFVLISVDIAQLIEVMERTIAEANQFVTLLVEQKSLPAA